MALPTAVRRRDQRLEARITPDQKELIERAACVQGRTVTDFVVSALQEAAKQAIADHTVWKLTQEQQKVFIGALTDAAALEPLLAATEALSERIQEYNQQIAKIAQESYPQVARLEQVKGVGTLIALTFLLTLEDPHRFRKSRDVGCYVGLQPGRRNSGQSEPQMHISKEGDPYLRTLLVQGAHH